VDDEEDVLDTIAEALEKGARGPGAGLQDSSEKNKRENL